MIKSHYICKRDGSYRKLDYHEADESDPDAVKDFFARHPPTNNVDYQLAEDERVFDHPPTKQELSEAFGGPCPI